MITPANNASLYCEWTAACKVGMQISSQNVDRRIMLMCESPVHGGNGFYTVQYARSSPDFGFYCTHEHHMFIMSANVQSFQVIHCFHTQMRNVDESLDQ